MKTYLLALAMFTAVASVIALAGVNTEVFTCGASICEKNPSKPSIQRALQGPFATSTWTACASEAAVSATCLPHVSGGLALSTSGKQRPVIP